METDTHPDSLLIDALGGTSKAAEFFGITAGAVSQWRRHGIPILRKEILRYAKPRIYKQWEISLPELKEPSHA